jgi:hypothetical protein
LTFATTLTFNSLYIVAKIFEAWIFSQKGRALLTVSPRRGKIRLDTKNEGDESGVEI